VSIYDSHWGIDYGEEENRGKETSFSSSSFEKVDDYSTIRLHS